jgi:hypothetical protein
VAIQAGGHFALLVGGSCGFENATHLLLVIDADGPLQAMMGEDETIQTRFVQIGLHPFDLVFGQMAGVAAFEIGWPIIGVEHDEMNSAKVEGVEPGRHSPERHRMLPLIPEVGVVISEDMKLWAGEGFEKIDKASVRRSGRAEISHLNDRIDLFLGHGGDKCPQAVIGIVHDVFVDIGDDSDAESLSALISKNSLR